MRIFGKTIGKTPEQREADNRKSDDAFMRKMSQREKETNRRYAKEDILRAQRDEKLAREDAERAKKYKRERERLLQQKDIEAQRSSISLSRSKTAASRASKLRGYKRTIQNAASLVGIKPKYDDYPYGTRGRAIYVSTSHGLKRINPNDPEYIERESYNPPPRRVNIRENRDDDYDQPSAFSGW